MNSRIASRAAFGRAMATRSSVAALVAAVCCVPTAGNAHADMIEMMESLAPTAPVSANLGAFDIVINPNVTLSGNAAALAAFNRAAQRWEAYIADPITVTINANLDALEPGVLGSTSSVLLTASYNTIRNAMVMDAIDEADDVVTSFLPTAAQFTVTIPSGFTRSGNLNASKANLKAMGFTGLDAQFGVSDANITFSTNFNFDYDNSDGISAGSFDFESVAAHEIGHALGFFSEVDTVDFYLANPSVQRDPLSPNPLDLFRFDDSVDPSTFVNFTTTPRSMIPGNEEHFDQITSDFGGAAEILMSTGVAQGDGRQASHWKDGLGLGLMDPTLAPGEISQINSNDLRSLDLIGYEILVVPEPAVMMPLAAAALLPLRRRRR